MNYTYNSPTGMDHSDAIVRKLNEIKNAIGGGSPIQNQRYYANRHPSSVHNSAVHQQNLNDYLPQDIRERVNSRQYHLNQDYGNKSQSYRHSLEKKLERLFKEERAGFSENVSFMQQKNQNRDHSYSAMINLKIKNPQSLTIDRMQLKIQQLQRKYMYIPEQKNCIDDKKMLKNKTKSMYVKTKKEGCEKQQMKKKTKQKNVQFEKRLLRELQSLKEQINWLKKNNENLAGRLQQKNCERKSKKERSKFLLNCIIEKLQRIQKQIEKKKKQQGRYHMETKAEEEGSNDRLMREVEDLKKKLRRVNAQKQIAEERSQWIENQLRKINQI